MRRRAALALAPLALLSLLLVGCGDDDKKASPSKTTEDAATSTTEGDDETGDDSTTTTGSDTTETDDTTSTTTTGTTAPGSTEPGGSGDFCTDWQTLNQLLSESSGETVEQIKASAESFAEAATGLVDIAPEQIAADMQTMADFFVDLQAAVADVTTTAEAEAAAQGLSSPEFNTAGNNVNAWTEENCPA